MCERETDRASEKEWERENAIDYRSADKRRRADKRARCEHLPGGCADASQFKRSLPISLGHESVSRVLVNGGGELNSNSDRLSPNFWFGEEAAERIAEQK